MIFCSLSQYSIPSFPAFNFEVPLLQLVPAVTELVISELLWLNYSSRDKPVYLYVNSIGSQTPDNEVSPHVCQVVSLKQAEAGKGGTQQSSTQYLWTLASSVA